MRIIQSADTPTPDVRKLLVIQVSSETLEAVDVLLSVVLLLSAEPESGLIFLPDGIDPASVTTIWPGKELLGYIGVSPPETEDYRTMFPWILDSASGGDSLLHLYDRVQLRILRIWAGSLYYLIATTLGQQLREKIQSFQELFIEFGASKASQLRALDEMLHGLVTEPLPAIERSIDIGDMREVCIALRGIPSEQQGYLRALELVVAVFCLWASQSFETALNSLSHNSGEPHRKELPNCCGNHLIALERSLRTRLVSLS